MSGADISEFEKTRTGDSASQYDRDNGHAFLAISELEKPTIAMIHGFCVGGGVGLGSEEEPSNSVG